MATTGETSRPDIRASIEKLVGVDPEAREYAEHGSVRDASGLSPSAREKVEQLMSEVDVAMKRCYRNAQTAVMARGDDVQYVEGFYEFPRLPPVKHAWIEVDGKIAEITYPKTRPQPPEDTVYFGREYDVETVAQTVADRGLGHPIAAPDYTRR